MALVCRPHLAALLQRSERSQRELQEIAAATREVAFFQSLPHDVHWACCKVMRLARYACHEIIFNKGDPGDSFCVLLSGSVSVLIPEQIDKHTKTLRQVSILVAGQAFGELALLQNRDRAATIQCREDSVLAVLGKCDFDRILRRQEDYKLRNKIEFFRCVPAFRKWSENTLSRFVYYFQELRCTKGTVVYRQGETSKYVYITVSGEFRLSLDSPQKKASNDTVLLLLSPKVLFGEAEALARVARQNTCICSSREGLLYYIDREEFARFVQKDSTMPHFARFEDAKSLWLEEHKTTLKRAEKAKSDVAALSGMKSAFQHSTVSLKLKKELMVFGNIRGKVEIKKYSPVKMNVTDSSFEVTKLHRQQRSLGSIFHPTPRFRRRRPFLDDLNSTHMRSISDFPSFG